MLFPSWETFYVIIGSSAGALTGLMFVVIAMIADRAGPSGAPPSEQTLNAFATPTVVHFSAALLLSAIIAAPWPAVLGLQLAVAVFGGAGVVYTFLVTRRARRQSDYRPVFEDWLFHAALPFVAYGCVLISMFALPVATTLGLFVIGGADVLLVFVGIHNAWDTVTYVIVDRSDARRT